MKGAGTADRPLKLRERTAGFSWHEGRSYRSQPAWLKLQRDRQNALWSGVIELVEYDLSRPATIHDARRHLLGALGRRVKR